MLWSDLPLATMSRPFASSRGPRGRGGPSVPIRGPPRASAAAASTSSSKSGTPAPSSVTTNTGVIGHKDSSGRIAEYLSKDDKCPACKTPRSLNPQLRLLVSPCYHKLCTSCIDRIWALGPAPCPECGTVCRKTQFGMQTFSDLAVEREVDVRKRIQRTFTKQAEDFDSLKDFNDYLEEVERITFNLLNGVDVEETQAKLTAFEKELRADGMASSSSTSTSAIQSASGDLLAQADAQILAIRQRRQARRRVYDSEDAQYKRQEEDEIVSALEDGQEEDELEAIQQKWRNQRSAIEARRDEEDQEDVREEGEVRRKFADAAAAQQQRRKRKKGAGAVDPDDDSNSPNVEGPSNYSCFSGPQANLSNGLDVLDSAKVSSLSSSLQLNPPTTAWTPFDPWTTPAVDAFLQQNPKFVDVLQAGGFDMVEEWRWQLGVALGSLGVKITPNASGQHKAT